MAVKASNGGFITVKGKEVIGPDGKSFLIKGTNLGNWLVPEGYMFKMKSAGSPRLINEVISELIGPSATREFWQKYLNAYTTEEDIQFLKKIGSNSLRLPFHYKLFTSEEYMGSNDPERGFVLFDRIVKWCKKHELYVILDMHCAPGGQTGDNIDDSWGFPFLFQNAADQQLTIDIWARIAKRYKNEPIIIGYDLLNEPIAHYFNSSNLNPYLEPLYKRIVEAIRKVDKNHIVFLGGAQWNSNFKIFGEPFDSKAIYTFHKYWTDTTQKVIQEYLDFRDKYNVPLYLGESGENNTAWITSFRGLLEKHNIGWHFWPYKKMESKSGIVEFKKPAAYDTIIHYADKQRVTFADLRKAAPSDRGAIVKILDEMINNSLFRNCSPNIDYIRALGLKD